MSNSKILYIFCIAVFIFNFCSCTTTNPLGKNSFAKEYFKEIAMETEWGQSPNRIRKWNEDIFIFIHDDFSNIIENELIEIIEEINNLSSSIKLSLTTELDKANVHLYNRNKIEAGKILGKEIKRDFNGYFQINYNSSTCIIHSAYIFLNPNVNNNTCLKHALREEVTQILGLTNDSNKFDSSIFTTQESCITQFDPIDKKLIRYILDPRVLACMDQSLVNEALKNISHK